jgi:mannan endo-1,4-beta-mannosidase
MAGFVAKDKLGSVSSGQTAPSSRFDPVVFQKPASKGAFSLTPDLADDSVYMDEFVNFVVNKYGAANTTNGVRGYSLDNEAPLWSSTHARIHPAQAGCKEFIDKSVALAKAVKAVDPSAEIFGPVFSNVPELGNFACTDWSIYSPLYNSFVKAYVAELRAQSFTAGKRLVDVLDIHYYPEAMGRNNSGTKERVYGGGNDKGVAIARMQAPRSLWDPTYIEDSWLNGGGASSSGDKGGYALDVLHKNIFPGINLFPANDAYAIKKIGYTEYDFGGHSHISGGIAQADVLGVFGTQGIYMGNFWGGVSNYVSAAYRLYRDYDGNKSTYGSVAVSASTNNLDSTMVYASINSPTDSSQLHLIVLGKSWVKDVNATFNITTQQVYKSAKVYRFTGSTGTTISCVDSIDLNGFKNFTYFIPHLSASHIVLDTAALQGTPSIVMGLEPVSPNGAKFVNVYPNPFDNSTTVDFTISSHSQVTIELTDILGKKVRTVLDQKLSQGNHSVVIEKNNLPAGVYFCKLSVDGQSVITKLVVN